MSDSHSYDVVVVKVDADSDADAVAGVQLLLAQLIAFCYRILQQIASNKSNNLDTHDARLSSILARQAQEILVIYLAPSRQPLQLQLQSHHMLQADC